MRLEKRRRDLKLYTHVLYGPWYHDHLLSPTILEEFCEQSYKHCLGSLAGIIDIYLCHLEFWTTCAALTCITLILSTVDLDTNLSFRLGVPSWNFSWISTVRSFSFWEEKKQNTLESTGLRRLSYSSARHVVLMYFFCFRSMFPVCHVELHPVFDDRGPLQSRFPGYSLDEQQIKWSTYLSTFDRD